MPHGIMTGVYMIFKDDIKVEEIHIGDNAEVIV